VLSSFPQAQAASEQLLEVTLGVKRIERLTERIGAERVAQRDAAVEAWRQRTLVEKERAPQGVKAPSLAAVIPDGGRMQRREANPDNSTHWFEYKAGCLLEMQSESLASDPAPELPELFLQQERMQRLTREIGKTSAEVREAPAGDESPAEVSHSSTNEFPEPPRIVSRDVVATLHSSREFGPMLAARAWELGFFGASRKAYVGDGSSWIWTICEKYFRPFGFVPILDFIHALTYVYAAALADQPLAAGWPVYVRWIRWVWQGEVSRVIVELAKRQQELGLPTDQDGPTSPRRIVSEALTYLQNQQSRMDYPQYRCEGLPITSSHIESTNKLLNHRVKGTEKFWSEYGGESMLQMKADTLSDTDPLDKFWRERHKQMNGCRHYTGTAA
jgi:hypothetical protein